MARWLGIVSFLLMLMPPAVGIDPRISISRAAVCLPTVSLEHCWFDGRQLAVLCGCLVVLALTTRLRKPIG